MNNFNLKPIHYEKIAVLAGNYQQFKLFCDEKLKDWENGSTRFEGCEFIYCDIPEHIYGYRFDDYMTCGTWYNNKNSKELMNIIRSCLTNQYYKRIKG